MTNIPTERGAALLDERVPGWEQHIDLDKLDLSSRCDCIVGQLNGAWMLGPRARYEWARYDRGRGFLNIDIRDAAQYGFTVWRSGRSLTAAWEKLILRRRQASARSRA